MKTQKVLLLITIFSFAVIKGFTQDTGIDKNLFPEPIGYVNDFEKILTDEQEAQLTKFLTVYEQNTTNEIAVVTLNTIETYSNFDQYAIDLSNLWGVGKKKKNNGLTIIFSKSLRKIRIVTGFGTEKKLTNEICKQVIDQIIIPEFKKGEFYDGVLLGLAELMKRWI
ncbi:hypothetical protein AWE51_25520 [Aquimarina aggregata]|uniref:TPM domain-containing protein n=2 Tax=Aquimarina aggregata TaxID=1642818 RepID=A0A162ZX04_9FLAO|nr:hypothetical protein AWE51_25520 [Aquimarina aggregata]